MRSTDVNETSSRSHLIFSIYIERTDKDGVSTFGKIIFIDLAGSESLSEIGVDPKRYQEGMQINESFIVLGQVIRQVAYKVTPAYELHPLTELMQDSLGSNSKTLMIACISPSIYDIAQTRQTLDFALTTGTITNKPTSLGLTQSFINNEEKWMLEEEIKQWILNSIIRSNQIIAEKAVKLVTSTLILPNMTEIHHKSLKQLRNLSLTQVQWNGIWAIGFTLSDGQ